MSTEVCIIQIPAYGSSGPRYSVLIVRTVSYYKNGSVWPKCYHASAGLTLTEQYQPWYKIELLAYCRVMVNRARVVVLIQSCKLSWRSGIVPTYRVPADRRKWVTGKRICITECNHVIPCYDATVMELIRILYRFVYDNYNQRYKTERIASAND